jgi:hypothetical protein
MTSDEDSGVGPAPPETVQIWIDLVRRMDRERLESFVARIRREWSTELPPALDAAVRARLRELQEAGASRGREERGV